MKILKGFITNSSSTSFLIAVRADVEKELVLESILDSILEDVRCFVRDTDPDRLEEEFDGCQIQNANPDDTDIKFDHILVAKEIADNLYHHATSGLTLDRWKAFSWEVSNESGVIKSFIYEYGVPNTDYVKTRKYS